MTYSYLIRGVILVFWNMREKHEQKMRITREESEQRHHYFAQQAELQLEILQQQLQNKWKFLIIFFFYIL